jgi:hypothetical protein
MQPAAPGSAASRPKRRDEIGNANVNLDLMTSRRDHSVASCAVARYSWSRSSSAVMRASKRAKRSAHASGIRSSALAFHTLGAGDQVGGKLARMFGGYLDFLQNGSLRVRSRRNRSPVEPPRRG